MAVEFRLLGDVEALVDSRVVNIGHARQRCVLVALLVDDNRVVSAETLLDRVWADQLPVRARATLSSYLSRLRQILAAAPEVTLTRQPGGYRLAVDPQAVDLHRFRHLVTQARAAQDTNAAAALFGEALALWRGEAFATLDTQWLYAVRESLSRELLAAELDRNDLALDRGEHASLLGELSARADAHPLDERIAGQLILALYRCGRQADALHHYDLLRRQLAEELGTDPGLPLRKLHQCILTADPAITGPRAPGRTKSAVLGRGRESFDRRAWGAAFAELSAADEESPLALDDLDRLAMAAHLTGRDDACHELWTRAHRELVAAGAVERAARCAFWLAFALLLSGGEPARASGWFARAKRLLDDGRRDCVEVGYLLVPDAIGRVDAGEFDDAYRLTVEAAEIGARFGDRDLVALAQHVRSRTLIRLGRIAEAVVLLDELMVAVTSGEMSAIVAGIVYCSMIEACQETFDLRRAREWTVALTRWCDAQPDLVPFTGQCLVHRAQIMALTGRWADAVDAARRATERFLRGPVHPAVGAAFYELAELHRIRGELTQAEQSYQQASRWGRSPQPGLALLRLAQGKVDVADAAIRVAIEEAADAAARPGLLAGCVEIMLAAGDIQAARAAADELRDLADDYDAPLLRAMARHTNAAVVLAEGDARAALGALRGACAAWQELDAPFEAARVRVLVGLARRQLGDEDTARMEWDAAGWVFERLGAAHDLARLEEWSRPETVAAAGGLTPRETQVLRLVATGKTNRGIAGELFLSEKTVARHVSNILAKLDVPSRAAATAYAYEHRVV
jgi:DNA-binding SARP family transcriptional activator/DNA-binding CsgD family transcriptional regulator